MPLEAQLNTLLDQLAAQLNDNQAAQSVLTEQQLSVCLRRYCEGNSSETNSGENNSSGSSNGENHHVEGNENTHNAQQAHTINAEFLHDFHQRYQVILQHAEQEKAKLGEQVLQQNRNKKSIAKYQT